MNQENDKENDCPTYDRFCRFKLSDSVSKLVDLPPVLRLPHGTYTINCWNLMFYGQNDN